MRLSNTKKLNSINNIREKDATTVSTYSLNDEPIYTSTRSVTETQYTTTITGTDANDKLNGTSSNNRIIGGKGNDTITGGSGNDIFIFNRGDGQDIISGVPSSYTVTAATSGVTTLVFNGIKSTDVTYKIVDIQKGTLEIHYGINDVVTLENIFMTGIKSSAGGMKFQVQFDDRILNNKEFLDETNIQYWVKDLSMGVVADNANNIIYYQFPDYKDGDTYESFKPYQKQLVTNILNEIEKSINVTFKLVTDADNIPTSHIMTFQNDPNRSGNELGEAVTTYGAYSDGNVFALKNQVFINSEIVNDENAKSGFYSRTYVHEIMHALGLSHTFDKFDESLITTERLNPWTVMSYTQNADPNSTQPYISKPQNFEIAALQALYGVNPNSRAGNNSYTFNNKMGTLIWDGSGADAINATNQIQNVTINLNQGAWSYVGTKSENISDANQLAINHGTDIERAYGGKGNDTLIGNNLNNFLVGNNGKDTIYGGDGGDIVAGGSNNDKLYGGNGGDIILGGTGSDIINGGAGNDGLKGGTGTNIIDGGTGTDAINYTESKVAVNVNLSLTSAQTTGYSKDTLLNIENLIGSNHSDKLYGNAENNIIVGNNGNDYIRGNDGNDIVAGGNGNDTLYGENGGDIMIAGDGNDTLYGNAGNDWFITGKGKDSLYGGSGKDVFDFADISTDTIYDFVSSSDVIRIQDDYFDTLIEGALHADNFVKNTTGQAQDANDHIIYNTKTGELIYDSDGIGTSAAQVFAILNNKAQITHEDIVVI